MVVDLNHLLLFLINASWIDVYEGVVDLKFDGFDLQ